MTCVYYMRQALREHCFGLENDTWDSISYEEIYSRETNAVMIRRVPAIQCLLYHYSHVIMSTMASEITSLTIVYSTIYSGADQSVHLSSASLIFVRGIQRWLVNSPHKWLVTRKMFPFDDVIMLRHIKYPGTYHFYTFAHGQSEQEAMTS